MNGQTTYGQRGLIVAAVAAALTPHPPKALTPARRQSNFLSVTNQSS